MKNPFKFGSVVDGPFFTNRTNEIDKVKSVLESSNHLVVISPRRYGKTSLVLKVVKKLKRPTIFLDLQMVTSQTDFASQLLKRIYSAFPYQKIKNLLKHFRIAPTISLNPLTNEIDVSYNAQIQKNQQTALEDVLNLIEKIGNSKVRPIVIFDEFQEITRMGHNLDRVLRSIMQHHQNINYIFLGSQESIIREIFEKKKSPFYHFGYVLSLGKIPLTDFHKFLHDNFKSQTKNSDSIADAILDITKAHPYYTQQIAFTIWEILNKNQTSKDVVGNALNELVQTHDVDYERLWNTLNQTDKKILIGMCFSDLSPLSNDFSNKYQAGASSTIFSSLKKMTLSGFVLKTKDGYEIDDPFFKKWLWNKRLQIN